ncbi:MAG: flagellar hook-length control protein FliK, partial [Thiobacillus sp.]|nr:flagellar hook-length control protein FliK [Thiobacillus sp.]
MFPNQALSKILTVQPVLDSTERDQAAPRAAFEHLKIGQTLTGLVKSLSNGVSLVEVGGKNVAMRLPDTVVAGDTLKLRFAGHMPQPVFMLETPETAVTDAPQLSKTARMLSDIMQRVPERALPTLSPPAPLLAQATAVPAELALALRTA